MKTVLKQFKVYAPPSIKEQSLNKDGTLTITGVASTTNQDLDGEIISEKALASLQQQAVGLNLHLDHNHDYNGGIGAITEAYVEGNALLITATVLPDFAQGILDRLKLGMNMGFSIGGIPIIKNSRSNIIDDFILLEISLTLLPANWDTFGTVESKGLIESNCLTGACHYILKEKNKKILSEDIMSEKAQVKVIDDATKQELVNIVNEAIINLKPLILDELKEEMSKLVQEVVATSLGDVLPKALGEIKAEVLDETQAIEQVQKEEEEIPVEEVPVEEQKETEEEVVEELALDGTPVEQVPVEEEKEVPEKVPLSGIPASPEDVQYVPSSNPIATPTYTIDSKAIAEAVSQSVSEEIWSKLNFKRNEVSETKLKQYKREEKKPSKRSKKFLDNETRDKFGRNKKYL